MKKFVVFLIVILVIISCIAYIYLNYKANFYDARNQNMQYENYLDKEIYGSELASIINKAVDNNVKDKVSKDGNGIYQDNQTTSINIQIKILDNDTTYNMETLYNGGMDNFVKYYNQIKFKCTKIEYHEKTNKIKYMLFEQISQ